MEEVLDPRVTPSDHQKALWWEFIALKDGPLADGQGRAELWIGWCPLCDAVRSDEEFTARFSFKRGLMWCERGCIKKRCVSLTNLLLMMRDRA